MVTLTELASTKISEIMEEREGPPLALRVYVQGGGCSGLSYGMGLDEIHEDDLVYESRGIKVAIDPQSVQYLQGCEIDYKEALRGGGFSISNPNAVRTCGCGSSFRTADNEGEPASEP